MRLLRARGDESRSDCQSMKPTNDIFASNEFYEALLRCRDEQPRRYAREVSPGLRIAVENYERRKSEARRKKAAWRRLSPCLMRRAFVTCSTARF